MEGEGGDTELDEETPPPATQPRTKRLRREGAISSLDELWDDPEQQEPEDEPEEEYQRDGDGQEEGTREADTFNDEETVANDGDQVKFLLIQNHNLPYVLFTDDRGAHRRRKEDAFCFHQRTAGQERQGYSRFFWHTPV